MMTEKIRFLKRPSPLREKLCIEAFMFVPCHFYAFSLSGENNYSLFLSSIFMRHFPVNSVAFTMYFVNSFIIF